MDWARTSQRPDVGAVDPRVRLEQCLAGVAPISQAEHHALALAALATIQRLFDNRFGTDRALKHHVGRAQAEYARFDCGSSLERALFPPSKGAATQQTQREALTLVAIGWPQASDPLRQAVIHKLAEVGDATSMKTLLKARHQSAETSDLRLSAERSVRILGDRMRWRVPAAGMTHEEREFYRDCRHFASLKHELASHTGGLHIPHRFFIKQRSQCLDVYSSAGRDQARAQIRSNLTRQGVDESQLSAKIEAELTRQYQQVFTFRRNAKVPEVAVRSHLNGGKLVMGGDAESRYLYTIDRDGLHVAREHLPMTSERKFLCHTNLSTHEGGAFTGGEWRFLDDGRVLLNCGSNRYGPRTAEAYAATIDCIRAIGFNVVAMAYQDFR